MLRLTRKWNKLESDPNEAQRPKLKAYNFPSLEIFRKITL